MESPLTVKEIEGFFDLLKRETLDAYSELLEAEGCSLEVHQHYPYLLLRLSALRSASHGFENYLQQPEALKEIRTLSFI